MTRIRAVSCGLECPATFTREFGPSPDELAECATVALRDLQAESGAEAQGPHEEFQVWVVAIPAALAAKDWRQVRDALEKGLLANQSSVNPGGVAVGQVWIEKDRRAQLPVLVVGIEGKKAIVVRGRDPKRGARTKVRLDRFPKAFRLESVDQ
jgi:hypothetical protein